MSAPIVRGRAGVTIGTLFFAAGAGVGGRVGLVIASVFVLVSGTYCTLNFLHCRETHCSVTGPGFLLIATLGVVAAVAPGSIASWVDPGAEVVGYLVVLAAGYALEYVIRSRTGRRFLR